MKKIYSFIICLILILTLSVNCFAAATGTNNPTDTTNADTNNPAANKKQPAGNNTSTDTGNFKLHTGYNDMFMHYDRYLNMKVGEKTKIYIYIPEKLFEGAKVTEITNNFPAYVSYSGDGTVEALKSIGYGRCLKIHTTVYLPKEDRYEHFTTKIHTYN